MRHLLLPLSLALAACQSPAAGPAPLDFTPTCGADRLQGLVGQDAGIISEIEINAPLRVIHPGMAVTEDYNPARLNIAVDENGIITRVWCV
ncbi:I78 family peptidase inhibitor [Aliiroseovarius sp.]|uniref:I78 family peptidase inhibitor n=1 Tax=Aliiroseovarius sp. TaxID=1872442 RepID=UPI003BAD9776